MTNRTLHVMGQDLEITETVVIQNSFVPGMIHKMCEEKGVFLSAMGNGNALTKIDYLPYRYQLLISGFEKVPAEIALTRSALCDLLVEYGFSPIREG